ncbi:tryptophan-rich sensory protein [Alkalihalobacillus hwajinpoensis]|uniref:TspO/MBR family protein n=1 Tax=Guptibacillus hwajinpoensis TaxID=208199 RepID=UPI0018844668|nr:TspO/MBR family protein [Pseudalkalibacillus hwajinpoensis]MBF0707029.1 tryptophan-rich sensory protein [Pseudalkalibacillus hwajinpoensis]
MGKFLLNLIAYILVVTVNALANALPLNGQTTGEISNRLNVLFTPAGYVFSIWGLIYLLLGIWVIRQFPKSRRDLPIYQETSGLFVLSSILNSLWIFMWHYEFFGLSVIVMLLLLFTLIRLYTNLKAADASFFDLLPFSVYLGWISVATIANISYYLTYIDWDGFGIPDTIWTFLLLIIATILALYFLKSEQDWIYPLVFVWAFIGIGVKNQNGDVPLVVYSSYVLAALILIVTLLYAFKRKK